jgi:hypothetical protein
MDIIRKMQKIKRGHLNISFSPTTRQEKHIFIQKLPDIAQIQDCTNHCPRGLSGAKTGKTILHFDIGKNKSLLL